LHGQTDPIKNRQVEYDGQSQALNELGHAIQMSYKAIEEFRNGDPKYDHLTETEILNITEQTEKTQKWLEDARHKLHGVKKTQDPPIKIADIRHEFQTLTTCVNSVLSRPKPTPPPPAPTAGTPPQKTTEENTQQNGNAEQPTTNQQQKTNEKQEPQLTDQMDVE
jgi:heat shock protein